MRLQTPLQALLSLLTLSDSASFGLPTPSATSWGSWCFAFGLFGLALASVMRNAATSLWPLL